jgi:hypothetical protein
MKGNGFLRLLTLVSLFMALEMNNTFAQGTERSKDGNARQIEQHSKKEMHKEELAKELNLTQKQREDLEKLKSEAQVEKGKMREKHRSDKMAMHDNYDKRLRTILDEKQYYAFKAKTAKHAKKMRKQGKNRHRDGHRD